MEHWFGNIVGYMAGLFTLVLGALFNANLNRRRDLRLRQEQRIDLLASLAGEVYGLILALADRRAFLLWLADERPNYPHAEQRLSLANLRVLEKLVDRMGLLGAEIAIDAFAIASHYDLVRTQLAASAIDFDNQQLDVEVARSRFKDIGNLLEALHRLAERIEAVIGPSEALTSLRSSPLAAHYGYVKE
jgi:hypothetical protein